MAKPKADLGLLKTSFASGLQAIGEAARAQDFLMTVYGIDGTTTTTITDPLTYLIQAATTPAIKREVVETVGPFGVRSIQQGRFMNEIEMAITFKEVVIGIAYTALKAWIKDKNYLTVSIELKSESNPSTAYTYWDIVDCWIELDGADLSVEDAVPLKLSGTLHGSYFPTRAAS